MRNLQRAALLLILALAALAGPQEQKAQALRDQSLQLLGDAAAAAQGVESNVERGRVLAEIGAAQWMAGDRATAEATFKLGQEALDTPREADGNPELTSFYQGAVASARAKVGDLEGAEAALPNVRNANARLMAVNNLIAAQLKAGKADDASRTALMMEDSNVRDAFLASAVSLRARQGDVEGAAKMAEVIKRPQHKVPALAALAVGLAKAKQSDRAQAVMSDAIRLAKEVRPEEQEPHSAGFMPGCDSSDPEPPTDPMFGSIVMSQAQMGDLPGAFETLERIQGKARRETSLVWLASFQGLAGDLKGARATAARIERKTCRARAQESIAIHELKARDLSGAAATIAAIEEPISRARALTWLAETQTATGQPSEALETLAAAQQIAATEKEELQRAQVLGMIAVAQMRAGRRDLATQTFADALAAARAHDEHGPPGAVERVAQAQAGAGLVAEGVASVQATSPQERPLILQRVMQAVGRGGGSAEAVASAQALTSSLDKAYALLGLAEGLLERANQEKPSGDPTVSTQKQ